MRSRSIVVSVLSILALVGGLLSVPLASASAVPTDSALTAKYGANEVKSVQRNPAWPSCTSGAAPTYDSFTVSSGELPYSQSTYGPVDLATVVPDGAYLKMFASGDTAQPWGIAMYQNTSNKEARWTGSAWVLDGDAAFATAKPFTEKGQAYGLYSGGFLHDSSPGGYGNYFLIGQSWPGANSLTYTPTAALNECTLNRAVASTGGMTGELTLSGPSTATVTEPTTLVGSFSTTVLGSPADANWTISGGADQALFEMAPTAAAATSSLSFKAASTPGSYVVEVSATDGTTTKSKTVTVTVNPPAPVISGSGAVSTTAPSKDVETFSADASVTWSISGGADSALFEIDAATGVLSLKSNSTPGTYVVVIKATNASFAGSFSTKTVTLTVSAPPLPVISGSASVAIVAPSTAVETLTANSTVTWTISGGSDAALFEIDSSTGVLSFKNSSSAGSYQVTVRAADADYAGSFSTITVTVTVTASGGGGGGGGGTPEPAPQPSASATATPTASAAPPAPALDPINNPDNVNVPARGLPQGGALLLVGGSAQPVNVTPNRATNPTGLLVTGEGWSAQLIGRGSSSDPLGLTTGGALVLQSQAIRTRAKLAQPVARATGQGFMPFSQVRFYILPSTNMGTLTTDASGSFAGEIPVPAGISPGTYTLQMNGLALNGAVRSLSLGVVVEAAANPVRTMTSSVRVTFAPSSDVLTTSAKVALTRLVRRSGTQAVSVRSVGYVQAIGSSANDRTLSTQRAKAVSAYLRSLDLLGTYVVQGNGKGGSGPGARKVIVTIRHVR